MLIHFVQTLFKPWERKLVRRLSFCSQRWCTNQFKYDTDNVEIEALCRALQLNIDLAYLNGVRGDAVDFIKFRHDLNPDAPPVVLLYRYVFYLNNP